MTTTPPEPPGPPSDDEANRPPAGAPGGGFPPPGGEPQPPAGFPPPPPPPPPSDPGFGTPQGYGQGGSGAPQPGYGQPAYGQPGGYPTGPAAGPLADWPKRALSGLIDFIGPGLVAGIFYSINKPFGLLLYFAAIGWAIYNAYLGGQTGQSYGKKIAGTRLISEATGQPPGGALGIGRYFLHILDSIPFIPVGLLWPLWDSKRQTFADKLVKTVVVTV